MEFAFTDEQAMIVDTAQRFFLDNATSERTRAAMAADGLDRTLWTAFCQDLGLSGIAVDEAMGGSGLGLVEFAIVAQAAGAQVAALPLLSLAACLRAIEKGGDDDQRARWLPRLMSGEAIAASGEAPNASFADGALSGDVSFLPHGAVADLFVLSGNNGAWIVERSAPGVNVKALTSLDQTRPFARLRLDGAPAAALPEADLGLKAAKEGGWLCLAAEALGGARACLERTCNYARERVQFGRPIGSFQAYKHRLADMMIEIEQAQSAVYWAACAVDEGSNEAPLSLHAAKSYCSDVFMRCAGHMIQLHGGIGYTWEHDAHLFLKRAKAIQEMMQNSAWHREQIAAIILGDAA